VIREAITVLLAGLGLLLVFWLVAVGVFGA
jgi:hypothetical protein